MPKATSDMEMPEFFAALLPKIRRNPLPLTYNGKIAAVAVSARHYEKMLEASEFLSNYDGELSPEEERALLRKAEKARKGGFIGAAESQKFTEKLMREIQTCGK